jgi:hypothetical protein
MMNFNEQRPVLEVRASVEDAISILDVPTERASRVYDLVEGLRDRGYLARVIGSKSYFSEEATGPFTVGAWPRIDQDPRALQSVSESLDMDIVVPVQEQLDTDVGAAA